MRHHRLSWRIMLAGAALCLLAPVMAGESFAPAENDTIRFAVLAFRPKPETLARWQPLVDHLNAAVANRRFSLEALTYPELEAAVNARRVGIVLTQPAHYILLANREGLYSPLATLIDEEAGYPLAHFGGVIVGRADRPDIKSLGDLRGKRIAASETSSLGGYLMQARELLNLDIRLPEDASVTLTGVPHDRAIQELLAGRAEAAFVRTGVVEAMAREGKLDPGRLRVINPQRVAGYPFVLSTPLYPEWALAAMPWLDDDTTRKVAVAILGLPHGGAVARAVHIHGFTIPGNYQPVEELMRQLRVPPFDHSPSFTIEDVWQRYQAWLSLAATLAALFLLLLAGALYRANRGLKAEQRQVGQLLAQLAESEERHRSLVVSSPDWIWEVDARGVYTYASPRVQDILGYLPEEVVGRTPFDFMTEAEAQRVRAEFADIALTRRPFFGFENVNLHKDGRPVVLETSGVPILDAQGGLTGYRGVDREITARKRAEQEIERHRAHLETLVDQRTADLRSAELRYRTVADFAYDWETWLGSDGTWLYCSPSCLRLTGHAAEEFMHRPDLFLDIVHQADREGVAAHLTEHLHSSGGVGRITFRIQRPDGSVAWLEHICQPVYGEDQEYLGRRASNRDVSDRRQAEIELIRARDAAMVANVAKNAFLANMSHEMRTPLHQIGGMAQLIRREPLTPRQIERMDKLDAALRHMSGMIERLLELTKIEAGRFALEEVALDPGAIVANVAAMVRDKAEAKGLRVLTETEPVPAGLLGDAMHIQAALFNLADNAVKFTDTGSVVIWLRLVETGSDHALLRFEVEDTGVGIAPETQARVFDVFEQADNSSTCRNGGTGIGLAMVRKLAQIMGGEAGCNSTPGSGSTFWFSVRLRKA